MARQRSKLEPWQQARLDGLKLAAAHPVFHYLAGNHATSEADSLATAASWVRVDEYGRLRHHPKRRASPEQWAWQFAHALLHYGLGHHDPVVSGGLRRDQAHQAACCVVVNRLLKALGIGQSPVPTPDYPDGDERSLAIAWRERGVPPDLAGVGSAGADTDLIGDLPPVVSPWRTSPADQLARGLAEAVSAAVDQAGGAGDGVGTRRKQLWTLAMSWFATSFPLLGGIAAGFTLVADAELCRRFDISLAAVDAGLAEIYVNPLAGLSREQWVFVLAHEMLHAGLRHGQRALGRDVYLWNVACDYVINGWLVELEVGEFPEGCLYDPELKGLSAEAIYDRIVTDARRFRKLATLRGRSIGDILGESLPLPREALGGIDLDAFYRRALTTGLAHHAASGRGLVPAGLAEEIRVLSQPPISWDARLARWFEQHVRSPEWVRSYARASRRQAATPEIPRPGRYRPEALELGCTFGVILDTSGSMSREVLGKALGAIASYAAAKDVPAARVVFCDAAVHDAGYLPVEEIAGRVRVHGRGGTVLQPAVRYLERIEDFPSDGPILVITDGACDVLTLRREHAFLVPRGARLPFAPRGPVFEID